MSNIDKLVDFPFDEYNSIFYEDFAIFKLDREYRYLYLVFMNLTIFIVYIFMKKIINIDNNSLNINNQEEDSTTNSINKTNTKKSNINRGGIEEIMKESEKDNNKDNDNNDLKTDNDDKDKNKDDENSIKSFSSSSESDSETENNNEKNDNKKETDKEKLKKKKEKEIEIKLSLTKITISSAIIELIVKNINFITILLIYLASLQNINLIRFSKQFY